VESAYQACLAYELIGKGFKIEQQRPLPVVYKGVKLDCIYRLDFVVDDQVIVELKSVESLSPVHDAQLLSYLKLSGLKIGLLINFNAKMLKNGIRRFVIGSFQ
jgi:GxxExxY protein